MLSFFPRGVLDEILNLIESVSEDFPSYSFKYTASSDDMQIIRTATPTMLLDGIMPLFYKHIFYSSTKLREMLVIVM